MWKSTSSPKSVSKYSTARGSDNYQPMTERRWLYFALAMLLITSAILACSIPSEPTEQPSPPEGKDDTLQVEGSDSLQLGDAVLDDVISTSDGETAGRILRVQISNPKTDELLVTIPCGLIFNPPPGSDEQRLMVIQQASASLPPGESADLTPYVICIDSSSAVPATGSSYQIGVMATGELLKLAQCMCNETLADIEDDPLAFPDQLGLQFAVWTVSDELSFDEIFEEMEEAEGALGEIGTGEYAEGLEELLGGIMGMFQDAGQEWLEKCDIEINQ